mgnify:FL=1
MQGKHTKDGAQQRPQPSSGAPRRPRTPAEARAMRLARQKARRRAQMIFFSASFAFILLVSWPISAAIDHFSGKKSGDSSSPAQSASEPASQADSAAASGTDSGAQSTAQEPSVPDGTQTSAVYGPVKSDEMTYTVPTAAMLALPENGRVDMAYFDDALFIGDSLTPGI